MYRNKLTKRLSLYASLLLFCTSVLGRSFVDVTFDQAKEDYDISYHLNDLGNLRIAKFCVPKSSPLGSLDAIAFRYEKKFSTTADPQVEGVKYFEYLVSFDVEDGFPEIVLIAIYQENSKTTELRVKFDEFGGDNWLSDKYLPVAELNCTDEAGRGSAD